MCGIVGFAGKCALFDHAMLVFMRDSMSHRGPDDSGCVVWDAAGEVSVEGQGIAGLAHRRLSIIDLSISGRQPMSNEDGKIWISYNGEFYNYFEHRQKLLNRHCFVSETDTETLLHLYEENGIEKTLDQINGMFAFAIWDFSQHKMYLARDRIGKKPIYYAHLDDGSLIFASELKALLASGLVNKECIDPVALAQFWIYGYATGERTIFSDVKRLLPGHFAEWHDGKLSISEYWDCPFGLDPFSNRSLDDMADELESLICDAIKLRLISDVPVGLFLSGGMDSSLLAALTAKRVGREVNSYTVGFADYDYDESRCAMAVADCLAIKNVKLQVGAVHGGFFSKIARHFDEPFGDCSSIPTYFVSMMAKDHVTVALTGDGGDELFAGYDLYERALFLWGNRIQQKHFKPGNLSFSQRISDFWFRYFLKNNKLSVLEMVLNPRELRKILSPCAFKAANEIGFLLDREKWYDRVSDSDMLSQFQYVNFKTYLPDDVLVKVDRMSMANSLECRSPLLDYRVVEFAARLPYEAKIGKSGQRKQVIRHILARYLPESLVDRPKRGFSAPWATLSRTKYGQRLRLAWLNQSNEFQLSNSLPRSLFSGASLTNDTLQWLIFTSLVFFEGFE